MFSKMLKPYWKIEKSVVFMIAAEFFIQMVNAAMMMVLNIYLAKKGYSDPEIADFISWRFLSVMLLAFPLGLYIKGRKIRPFFYFASVGVSLFSLGILFSVEYEMPLLVHICLAFWGIAYACMQVLALPFILRNTSIENQSAAISLSYSTYSFAMISSGTLIFLLNYYNPDLFHEYESLLLISALSILSVFFVWKMGRVEVLPKVEGSRKDLSGFDWKVIAMAMTPSLILAIGAGLTIPFINLFFYKVYNMSAERFSIINAFSSLTVAFAALLVPHIKNKYGYKVAITRTQTIAVASLALLACTEFYSTAAWAYFAAVFFFLLRQPLMNMAAPAASELVMNYVGPKNQEIISALTASIWSGSWFLSAIIFRVLRNSGMMYANVFLITAALYAFGVIWYYYLINLNEKKNI
jgi:predicted MFS family arabinose efflux permease